MRSVGRPSVPILSSLREVTPAPKAWYCDVWGVLHNGVVAFEPAVAALRAFRALGGFVILISNSPRTQAGLIGQLRALGIGQDCFDAAVTSGDVTRTLLAERAHLPVYHIGPERDLGFFDGLAVRFASPDEAELIVCTGLFDDENETPEQYDGLLRAFAEREVPMICANPDVVVERGGRLIPCAGALAARYEGLGQQVLRAGKPHAPIYTIAQKMLPSGIEKHEILAIGDGIDTDIKGAAAVGIASVYIASRVNLSGAGRANLTSRLIGELFAGRPFFPVAAAPELRW